MIGILAGMAAGPGIGCGSNLIEGEIPPAPPSVRREERDPGGSLDLGSIVASGQVVREKIRLTNPFDRSIRLLKGIAVRPCCSSVEELPTTVGPRASVDIPVTFKPGQAEGLQRVEYHIITDDVEQPRFVLMLRCRVFPELTIRDIEATYIQMNIGESRSFRYELIRRIPKTAASLPPDRFTTEPPDHARFVDSPKVSTPSPEIREVRHILEVNFPARSEAGVSEVLFRMKHATRPEFIYPFRCSVESVVKVEPQALVIRSDSRDSVQTLRIWSRDGPMSVTGIIPESFATDLICNRISDFEQIVQFRISDNPRNQGGVKTVSVRLQHAKQAEVRVPILFQEAR